MLPGYGDRETFPRYAREMEASWDESDDFEEEEENDGDYQAQ